MRTLGILTWVGLVGLAGPSGAGTLGAEAGAFAAIDVGARTISMGSAGTVVADGALASFWNPARLYEVDRLALAIDTANLYGLRLAQHTAVGLAWARRPSRHVVEDGLVVETPRGRGRLVWGAQLAVTRVDLEPEVYTEVSPGLSVAAAPWDGVATGATLRILLAGSDLENTSASGIAVDLGATWRLPYDLEAGAAVKNLLSSVAWSDDTSDTLPVDARLGVGYQGYPEWTVGAELALATDQGVQGLRGGAEWRHPSGALALRGGVRQRLDRLDSPWQLTLGAGTGVGGLGADYAFAGDQDLKNNHRFSLTYRF